MKNLSQIAALNRLAEIESRMLDEGLKHHKETQKQYGRFKNDQFDRSTRNAFQNDLSLIKNKDY